MLLTPDLSCGTCRVHRQLYPVLFVAAAALAVVVLTRPNVAEELSTLARLSAPNLLGQVLAAPPGSAPPGSSGNYQVGNPMFAAAGIVGMWHEERTDP